MKKELSWMPLASGSEAITALNGRRYADDQTDTIMRPNVDRKRERGNCTSFILAVNLCKQAKHKHAPIVNATGCTLRKRAIEDTATMQYFGGRCRSRFTSLNLNSRIRGEHERSSRRIRRFAS